MTARPRAVPSGGSALKPAPPVLVKPPEDGAVSNASAATATAAHVPTQPAQADTAPPASTPAASPAADNAPPPPPPARSRHTREQFNSKIRVDLRARLNAFVERHESTLQGVLEASLDEYMERRGWSWDDFYRAQRKGS